MRTLSVTLNVQNDTVLLFPNGHQFNSTDVFLGSGFIDKIVLSQSDITPTTRQAVVTAYDYIHAANQRTQVGGTTTTGAYRLIAGGTIALANENQPYVLSGTPNAQLTACRKIVNAKEVSFGSTALIQQIEIPVKAHFMFGMAIVVAMTSSSRKNLTYEVHYTPHVSGGTRKRQKYAKGTTTIRGTAARTNLPL